MHAGDLLLWFTSIRGAETSGTEHVTLSPRDTIPPHAAWPKNPTPKPRGGRGNRLLDPSAPPTAHDDDNLMMSDLR